MSEPTEPIPASGLHLIVSNQLETLAGALAGQLGEPWPSASGAAALKPEIVLIQSKGMQRWLSMQIARHNGICANLCFPFPNALIDFLYARAVQPLPQRQPYERSTLAFRIMRMLPKVVSSPEYVPLRRYFNGRSDPLKAYQLSLKIADLFDQYMVYRPEILKAWEAEHNLWTESSFDWQGMLWRSVRQETGILHRAELQYDLVRRLRGSPEGCGALPGRLFIFGISHLPPFHLEVLEALAGRVPVYFFALNPCRHYWFDIVSDHHLARIQAQSDPHRGNTTDLHFERGNRLLASWGRQGKHFFSMLHALEPHTTEMFADRRPESLLECLQNDILELVDHPVTARFEHGPDGSIRIHCCHSAMREVEVLYDQLLSLFDSDPDLKPRDILVMTPDIDAYAPYVHAVFGSSRVLPYSLADQNVRRESRVPEAFLRLLDLKDSRFEAASVLALLEFDAIREQAGLDAADILSIEEWVRQANIRWGWDGADRKRQALPGFTENSWRAGLDRLLLGYAMASDGERLYEGVLPSEAIEGSQSRALGDLTVFVETLYETLHTLPDRATLNEWRNSLGGLIDLFFHVSNQSASEIQMIRNMVNGLSDLADESGDGEVAFEVIRYHIRERLERMVSDGGFIVGGITFCALLPMRSIPAQIICLLGLQHDAFPQDSHEPKFNLISTAPRPGDRSKRNDDKYLFLEALLSARRVFYVSYIGRRIQDNARVPPSVLVDELIDCIGENYAIAPDQLLTEHPLQGFSPSYFDNRDPRLFSYSTVNLSAARQLGRTGQPRTFFDSELPEPADSWRKLDVQQLITFYHHPIRFLFERRLGIRLSADIKEIDDREPFNLDALSRFAIEQKMVKALMQGQSLKTNYAALRAAGSLPHGTPGKAAFERIASDSIAFMDMVKTYAVNKNPRSVNVKLLFDGFEVSGEIDQIYNSGTITFRMAKLRPQDLLTVFLKHLLLAALEDGNQSLTSILITKDAIWQFGNIPEPKAVLGVYLNLYWTGLRRPLRFFPLSSYAYAYHIVSRNMPPASAMKAAWSKWHSSDFAAGDADDPYLACAFSEQEGLTADFQEIALAVFQPLLEAGQPVS